MDAAISEGQTVLERTIDLHIKTLRKKIGDADMIETVRGVGYRFREGVGSRGLMILAPYSLLPIPYSS